MLRSRHAILVLACALLLALTIAPVGAQPVSYEGHSLLRIDVGSQDDVDRLQADDIDVWSHGLRAGYVDARVTPEQRAALEARGATFDVLKENLGPQVEAERARLNGVREQDAGRRGGGFNYTEFFPLDSLIDYLNELVAAHPDLAQMHDFGTTIEGRTVWGIHITGAGDPADKPGILIDATQHAREWLAPPVPVFAAEHLLTNYGVDPEITELVDRIDWYLIPVVNPDGYVYTWGPDRYWRKNRRNNGGGSFGVDLNRNWGHEWGGSGSSGDSNSEVYRGTAPFSEPETQNLRDFILDHGRIRSNIDFHSYGEYILWPWAYSSAPCPDNGAFIDVGYAMRDVIQGVHGRYYTSGSVGSVLYLAAGGSVDWVYVAMDFDPFVHTYTIELRGNDFVISPSEILPTCEENLQAILSMARDTTGALTVTLPSGPPILLSPTQPTVFDVLILPGAETLEPGSATLDYRFDSESEFTSIGLTPVQDDLYEAQLPSADCASAPEFYITATGSGGTLVTDPPGAPDTSYEAGVGDVTIEFADDFEMNLGWTVSGTATDGQWTRGVPIGGGDRGDPPTDEDGSGKCYLTDNVDGNSDVDNGTTVLTSPTLDLTAVDDPSVGYARWYSNSSGSAPFADVFTVEVSDNGGGSWVELETVGPGGDEVSGGWYTKSFRIADFVELTDSFRIRFTAADEAQGSVVEAGIDAFSIFEVTCESSECEGDANGDGTVDPLDSGYVLARFGCPVGTGDPSCDAADQNGDGAVDPLDSGFVLARFGACE